MRQNALLRLLLACFLLYIALPYFHIQGGSLQSIFSISWMAFFLLVAGANLAILLKLPAKLQLTEEVEEKEKRISFGKN